MAISKRKMVSWDKSTTSVIRRRIYNEAMDLGHMPEEITISIAEARELELENKRIVKRLEGVRIVRGVENE